MDGPLLIIGQSGQLARALARRNKDAITVPRRLFDLTAAPEACDRVLGRLIESHKPRGVINAAAYTQVDLAETERALAFRVNADAPGLIAQACARATIPFVHISTDYVFNGHHTQPWREGDPTGPLNVYGQSKLAGEQAVRAVGARSAILRTSWVYDLDGRNFVTTMLRLADTHDALKIVDDQVGRPTHANVLADAALAALGQHGLFHVSGTGDPVSWAGFAKAVFSLAQRDVSVLPIPSSEFPTDAARPAYSVLDTSKFEREITGIPRWEETLAQAFSQTG